LSVDDDALQRELIEVEKVAILTSRTPRTGRFPDGR
jgi:hypothetical protein